LQAYAQGILAGAGTPSINAFTEGTTDHRSPSLFYALHKKNKNNLLGKPRKTISHLEMLTALLPGSTVLLLCSATFPLLCKHKKLAKRRGPTWTWTIMV
jgi:hypothetical protein